jgi:N6-adenosine-specific RNA methylase IME4
MHVRHENEIIAHKDEATTFKFLKPFPLLMTADSKGVMYIWYINPQLSGAKKCVMKWTNKVAYMNVFMFSHFSYIIH